MNDLRNLRTGLGMDVHAFAPGRKLILGGVDIPHHQGLDGHSDADVLAHAISDALPHREAMRENLAHAMDVSVDAVGVKATTTEHLGPEGREEGITAYATCLVCRI